jgi:uncharacterized SAM-binding protein YcdF (DUF218 family)
MALLLCSGAVYLASLAWRIRNQSRVDEARPADVIVILGAAEYRGFPSPVLRARLDHGLELFRQGLAPHLLTTGGAGGDPDYTEGEVGRAYLIRAGVPSESIIVEHEGESTVHSLVSVAEIMTRMGLRSAIVVSDGYHVFRAKRILESRGIRVYGSPRPTAEVENFRKQWLYVRQAVGYVLWSIGVAI